MIFVTLGSQKFQFDRLLRAIDMQIGSGRITDTVFAQTGYSSYVPENFGYKDFLDRDEFSCMQNKCDIIITHGGTGAIVSALKKSKKVIAVARLEKYGEHVDDHQLQIIKQFTRSGLICECNDCDRLGEIIEQVRNTDFVHYVSNTETIIKDIDSFITSTFDKGC